MLAMDLPRARQLASADLDDVADTHLINALHDRLETLNAIHAEIYSEVFHVIKISAFTICFTRLSEGQMGVWGALAALFGASTLIHVRKLYNMKKEQHVARHAALDYALVLESDHVLRAAGSLTYRQALADTGIIDYADVVLR